MQEDENTHLVHLIIHAIPSVVTAEAAQTTSPSFSRLSSSMTTTNSPRLIASIASGTGSNWKGVGGVVGGLDTWVGRDIGDGFGEKNCFLEKLIKKGVGLSPRKLVPAADGIVVFDANNRRDMFVITPVAGT